MKIGLVAFTSELDSVQSIWRMTGLLLSRDHELVLSPRFTVQSSTDQRREDLTRWLTNCDVVFGPLSEDILVARENIVRPLPYVCLLLGSLSRGTKQFRTRYALVRTSDVLLGNCRADVALALQFFPNATARSVPFAFDDLKYFRVDEAARKRHRALLGIGEADHVLLYSGRIGLEKNLHSVLTTFRVVLNAVPNTHLVIAGRVGSESFPEFGGSVTNLMQVLRRLRQTLSLGTRVLFVGPRTPDELRALYGAADLLVNLTLHHDENFGLSQVEAMACGLPVIGTTWGGLNDTIVHGVTGIHVPAKMTAAGVKIDWWRAADAIVRLLRSAQERHHMCEQCVIVAQERYSPNRYAQALGNLFDDCLVSATTSPVSHLRPSPFARAIWKSLETCRERKTRYGSNETAFSLYRQLIAPFAHQQNRASADVSTAWCLASPLRFKSDLVLAVNDLLYPFNINVPAVLAPTVSTLLELLAEEPVLTAGRVTELAPELRKALEWMHEAGLVLTTERGTLELEHARRVLAKDWFSIVQIDDGVDLISMI